MQPQVKLNALSGVDEQRRGEIHRLLCAVVELGGAIGYDAPPPREDTDRWLDDVLRLTYAGDAAVFVATVAGPVAAIGLWRRGQTPNFHHCADVEKVMVHPSARGRGLGHRIVDALVGSARDGGVETLTLGVRGNNHGAIQLYEQHGFRQWGRLPNVIEVGDERYDDVRMFRELGRRPSVVLRGSGPGGPGSSPASRAGGSPHRAIPRRADETTSIGWTQTTWNRFNPS